MSGTITISSADLLNAVKPQLLQMPEITQQPYSYVIYTDGTTVYAKNGYTGQIDYSGTDASTIINNVLNVCYSGCRIIFRNGTYVLNSTITIQSPTVIDAGKALFKLNFGNNHAIKLMSKGIVWRGGVFDALVSQGTNYYVFYANPSSYTDMSHDPIQIIDVEIVPSTWGKIWGGIYIGGNVVGARIVNPRIRNISGNGIIVNSEETEIIGGSINANNVGIQAANNNIRIVGVNIYNAKTGIDVYVPSYSQGKVVIANSYIADNGYTSIFVHTDSSTPSDARTVIIGNIIGGGNWNNKATNDGVTSLYGTNIVILNASGIKVVGNEFIPPSSGTVIGAIGLKNSIGTVVDGNSFRISPALVYRDTTSTAIIGKNYGYTSVNGGTAMFSGDGTTTQFRIPHGLASTPSKVLVTPGSSDAQGAFYVTADATYIYVNYATAPPSGTNNIVLYWYAEV
jgi:hypothetical protein